MVLPSSSTEVLSPDEMPVVAPGKLRPMLTEQSIKAINYDLKMAEKLVTEVLENAIDYGQIPGVRGKGLWDPGASKIMNAFECYPRHKILYHEETKTLITWAIEAEIIHRPNGAIVGAGVGACSTREPKYGKRWLELTEVQRLGYTQPEIDKLKTRKGKRWEEGKSFIVDEYHVENPEYGEQVNTIFKMAAKRAEVDGAQTLPGVASALRRLFDPQKPPGQKSGSAKRSAQTAGSIDEDSPRWTSFWNQMKNLLGDDYQEKTHKICGVTSMSDWLKGGKSLGDATRLVIEQAAVGNISGAEAHKVDREPEAILPPLDPKTVKEAHVKTADHLEKCMTRCYGWSPERLWAEANYHGKENFGEAGVETPWEVFCRLRNSIARDLQGPDNIN